MCILLCSGPFIYFSLEKYHFKYFRCVTFHSFSKVYWVGELCIKLKELEALPVCLAKSKLLHIGLDGQKDYEAVQTN